MRNYLPVILISLFLVALLFSTSCEEEKVEPEPQQDTLKKKPLNASFYELMKQWYLWYDTIPEVNPHQYDNPLTLLEAIKYERDQWSYITSYAAFQQYYEEGAYIGYGFGYKWDSSDSLRISFVFEDSPLKKKHV